MERIDGSLLSYIPSSLNVLSMDSGLSSSSQVQSKWAVLVGVDFYPGPEHLHLKGCCNEAVLVYDFPREAEGMKIPDDNIRLHLSPDPALGSSTQALPKSKGATVFDFLHSLDDVIDHSKPGDFVHIHFSGHGSREPTQSPHKKSYLEQDEWLCFTDGDISDLEFGQKLDDMTEAPHNLVVLVTLDCCFSGGTTRWGKYSGVRRKPRDKLATRADIPAEMQN